MGLLHEPGPDPRAVSGAKALGGAKAPGGAEAPGGSKAVSGVQAPGSVVFLGAGPGAPDLLTLRGHKLLSEADLVVYAGSLVNPALLSFCRPDCEILDSAVMTLPEVLEALVRAAGEGKRVVRLHTGDPSVYGAIREQMDGLRKAGVPFSVCPGVSSFSAAAAAIPAEYTLPGVSQTVILSRAEGRTEVPEKEQLELLAAHQASLVLFLSAGQLETVSRRLIAGGYPPDTPAALVYKASWPEEQVVRATLEKLPEAGRRAGITRTALILVGGFLGENYALSKLYSPAFETGYRKRTSAPAGEGGRPEAQAQEVQAQEVQVREVPGSREEAT